MKTVFKKTVLLSAVVLAGLVATIHDSSAPIYPSLYPRFHPVTNSNPMDMFSPQESVGDVATRVPRRVALINTTLAGLQEGILGDDSIDDDLKQAPKDYLAIQ